MTDDEKSFETMVENFEETLSELGKNKQFEKYFKEFEKMMQVIKDSYSTQHRLINKCRELKAEIVINDEKIADIKSQSCEDKNEIEKLKEDLERSLKNIDNAQKKELKAKEQVRLLKSEIAQLKKSSEKAILSLSEEKQAVALHEDVITERDNLKLLVTQLKEELINKGKQEQKIQDKLSETLTKLQEYENELNASKANLETELKRRRNVDKESINLQKEIKAKDEKIEELEAELLKVVDYSKSLEGNLNSHEEEINEYLKDMEELRNLCEKLKNDVHMQSESIQAITAERDCTIMQLQEKEEEIRLLKEKVTKTNKVKDASVQKVTVLKNNRKSVEMKLEVLKTELITAEKEMNSVHKQHSQDERNICSLTREKELLANNLIRMESLSEKYLNEFKGSEQAKVKMAQELKNSQEYVERQKKVIASLERGRHRLLSEVNEVTRKMEDMHDQIRLHESRCDNFKKQIAELTTQLKQQSDLCQATANDRQMYSKCYKEAKESMEQQKEKVEVLNHYIDQLKEDARERDDELREMTKAKEKVEGEKRNFNEKLKKQQAVTASVKFKLKYQEDEIRQHLKIIAEKEKENGKMQFQLNEALNERNILGVQLLRRNDEIALLNEKIQVHIAVIMKGEHRYMQCVDDLKLLKQELFHLFREKRLMANKLGEFKRMKQDLIQVQQELVKERTKGLALEKEMQQPLNIHRWRLLQGTDPERYELVMKSHVLQKRLISKSHEAEKKNLELKEKEKIVEELKTVVARQTCLETADQMVTQKRQLLAQSKKIKSLTAQVNMYETYMSNYKLEIEKLKNELRASKKSQPIRRIQEEHKHLGVEQSKND